MHHDVTDTTPYKLYRHGFYALHPDVTMLETADVSLATALVSGALPCCTSWLKALIPGDEPVLFWEQCPRKCTIGHNAFWVSVPGFTSFLPPESQIILSAGGVRQRSASMLYVIQFYCVL